MTNERLYAERDIEDQGEHYARHVNAMTAEGLHAKSDIAAELAHRDIEIDRLQREFDEAARLSHRYRNDAERLRAALKGLISGGEFMAPNLDVLTGSDAIACSREWHAALAAASAALGNEPE